LAWIIGPNRSGLVLSDHRPDHRPGIIGPQEKTVLTLKHTREKRKNQTQNIFFLFPELRLAFAILFAILSVVGQVNK
jgi:hypothetical protein